MGLNFPASVTCDKCDTKTSVRLEVTALKPQPSMHLKLPDGWAVSSKVESGELFITCPKCPPVLVSMPPIEIAEAEAFPAEDPATGPTLRPPPLPKI